MQTCDSKPVILFSSVFLFWFENRKNKHRTIYFSIFFLFCFEREYSNNEPYTDYFKQFIPILSASFDSSFSTMNQNCCDWMDCELCE